MIPAVLMLEAYHAEMLRSDDPLEAMRAALRALAEMYNPLRGLRRHHDLPIYEELLVAAKEGEDG